MTEEPWTTLVFDSQVLSAFMGCPQEMDYRFNQHLVPITSKAAHYDKGTLIHHGLEKFYSLMKEGHDWNLRRAESFKAMRELSPTLDLDSEAVLDCYRAFEEYCEYRKNDVFQVLFTEHLFRVKIYENEGIRLRIFLTGRIDLGVMEGTTTTPIDHKTESESWFYSANSNQFKIYALACNSPKLIVNRFGFQKTVKAEKKFERKEIYFEKEVLEEFKNVDIPYYATQMILAKESNFYPRNFSNCIKGHFGCIFSDKYNGGVCNIKPELRQRKLEMHFKVKEWNINSENDK